MSTRMRRKTFSECDNVRYPGCYEIYPDYFQIMSATVLPAGMNGNTCSV